MADHVTKNPDIMEEVHQPEPGHAGQVNPLLSLDPGMAVWFWLVFFAFVFVLWKLAWKLIAKMLDERKSDIQKAIKKRDEA